MIREGFRSIGTHGFMSFATVTIIMACLIIMGSVTLLSLNIDRLIKGLENQNEVVAFVDDTYSEEDARALQSQIDAIDNIGSAAAVRPLTASWKTTAPISPRVSTTRSCATGSSSI